MFSQIEESDDEVLNLKSICLDPIWEKSEIAENINEILTTNSFTKDKKEETEVVQPIILSDIFPNLDDNLLQPNLIISENKISSNAIYEENKKLNFKTEKSRGRERTLDEKFVGVKRVHDKFDTDNVYRKIQVHYLSNIIKFFNSVLRIRKLKERFLDVNYKFKSNITKKNIIKLKNSKISFIFEQPINGKYTLKDTYFNKKILAKVKKDYVINNLLNVTYLELFNLVYCNTNKKINLSGYGIDLIIDLDDNIDNIEIFQDLEGENKDDPNFLEILKESIEKIKNL